MSDERKVGTRYIHRSLHQWDVIEVGSPPDGDRTIAAGLTRADAELLAHGHDRELVVACEATCEAFADMRQRGIPIPTSRLHGAQEQARTALANRGQGEGMAIENNQGPPCKFCGATARVYDSYPTGDWSCVWWCGTSNDDNDSLHRSEDCKQTEADRKAGQVKDDMERARTALDHSHAQDPQGDRATMSHERKAIERRDMWIFAREALSRGATVEREHEAAKSSYESYSCRLDAAASEFAYRLEEIIVHGRERERELREALALTEE